MDSFFKQNERFIMNCYSIFISTTLAKNTREFLLRLQMKIEMHKYVDFQTGQLIHQKLYAKMVYTRTQN